ncbi:MAG: response regulator [Anaerolineae bacterium]
MPGERILVVDDTAAVAKLITAHLESAGYKADSAKSGVEALELVAQGTPDLVMIDVMMPGMDGFQLTQKLRANPRTAHTPIIIVTARDSVEDKVRGFEVGADDYMVKPFEPPELLARVRALLLRARPSAPTAAAPAPMGSVVAVFGLRGGAGRSTIAANLSVAIAAHVQAEVALCDLAIESSHISLMLDARPVHTVDELVTRYGSTLESDVLMAYLTQSRYGVRILAAPLTPASAPLVTADGVRAVVESLRRRFPFVVLDLAHTFSDLNLGMLELADAIIVVTTPEMAGVKTTAAAFEILESLGYPPERVHLALNTIFGARPLAAVDIAGTLNRKVDLNIPYERSLFVDAINKGVPAVREAPRSAAARAIQAFAASLVSRYGGAQEAPEPAV